MKKVLFGFFVTLGVIFFILLIGIAYFVIADPFHLKPLFFGSSQSTTTTTATTTRLQATTSPQGSGLTEAQKKALETIGINPSALPSSIAPAQEACFVSILGTTRVAEIKKGAVPTVSEMFSARGCLSL